MAAPGLGAEEPVLGAYQMDPPEVLSPTEPWMTGDLPQSSSSDTQPVSPGEPIPFYSSIDGQPREEETFSARGETMSKTLIEVEGQVTEASVVYELCQQSPEAERLHHTSDPLEAAPVAAAESGLRKPVNQDASAEVSEPPDQDVSLATEANSSDAVSTTAALSGDRSGAHTKGDLGAGSGSLGQSPASKGGVVTVQPWPSPERSPLSKPSAAKATQEWRKKKGSKENSPIPKYKNKGPKGVVVGSCEGGTPKPERCVL